MISFITTTKMFKQHLARNKFLKKEIQLMFANGDLLLKMSLANNISLCTEAQLILAKSSDRYLILKLVNNPSLDRTNKKLNALFKIEKYFLKCQ